MRRVLLALVLLLLLAGCDSRSAADLRSYLHDQYQYQHDYHEALDGAQYAADGDTVTIKTRLYFQATDGQEVCNWASDWLYDGSHNGSIRVLNRDGDVLSQRHAEADVCSFG